MENFLDKAKLLVKENLHTFKLGRKVKSTHLFENQESKCDFFDMEFEALYDNYKTRWEWNEEWGGYTDGLGELVKTMEQNRHLPEIRLTSFYYVPYDFLLFSDPNYTVFLGLLIVEKV